MPKVKLTIVTPTAEAIAAFVAKITGKQPDIEKIRRKLAERARPDQK